MLAQKEASRSIKRERKCADFCGSEPAIRLLYSDFLNEIRLSFRRDFVVRIFCISHRATGRRIDLQMRQRQRVLVVDDDHLVADTLRMIFVVNGFESEACYSAADALHKARSFDPELLLCDVTMPGENGLQLAAAISREIPKCQMIMLTAYLSNAASVELEALRMKR